MHFSLLCPIGKEVFLKRKWVFFLGSKDCLLKVKSFWKRQAETFLTELSHLLVYLFSLITGIIWTGKIRIWNYEKHSTLSGEMRKGITRNLLFLQLLIFFIFPLVDSLSPLYFCLTTQNFTNSASHWTKISASLSVALRRLTGTFAGGIYVRHPFYMWLNFSMISYLLIK